MGRCCNTSLILCYNTSEEWTSLYSEHLNNREISVDYTEGLSCNTWKPLPHFSKYKLPSVIPTCPGKTHQVSFAQAFTKNNHTHSLCEVGSARYSAGRQKTLDDIFSWTRGYFVPPPPNHCYLVCVGGREAHPVQCMEGKGSHMYRDSMGPVPFRGVA